MVRYGLLKSGDLASILIFVPSRIINYPWELLVNCPPCGEAVYMGFEIGLLDALRRGPVF